MGEGGSDCFTGLECTVCLLFDFSLCLIIQGYVGLKVCREIVTLGIDPKLMSPNKRRSAHLSPLEFHDAVTKIVGGEDAVLIDCRNSYESDIGCFLGAFAPQTRSFRYLPLQ